MNDYSIALFLHISGVLGMFAALVLEWTGLWQTRSAMVPDQVRAWLGILKSVQKVGFASMLTILISGAYMMATVWGGAAWIAVSLVALVLAVALTLALTGPRMKAIGRALVTERGTLSPTLHRVANQPLLWVSIQTRVAILLGVVLLKTTKPDLSGSLLILGAAMVLGLASALPLPSRARSHETTAN